MEPWQGRDLNTAIPKDTTPLTRLLWSTAHLDYKKKTFKGLSFAFDLAYVHQEDDVAPRDGCQADWSRLQLQNLRQMAKIFFVLWDKMAGIPKQTRTVLKCQKWDSQHQRKIIQF